MRLDEVVKEIVDEDGIDDFNLTSDAHGIQISTTSSKVFYKDREKMFADVKSRVILVQRKPLYEIKFSKKIRNKQVK